VPGLSSLTNLSKKSVAEFPDNKIDVTQVPLKVVSSFNKVKRQIDQVLLVRDELTKELEQLVETRNQSKREIEESLQALTSVKKKTISEVGFHTQMLTKLKERENGIISIQNDYVEFIDRDIRKKRSKLLTDFKLKERVLQKQIDFLKSKEKVLAETYVLIAKIHENLLSRSSQDELERLQIKELAQETAQLEKELVNRSQKLSDILQKVENDKVEVEGLKNEIMKDRNLTKELLEKTSKEILAKEHEVKRKEKELVALKMELEITTEQQKQEARRLKDWSATLQRTAQEIARLKRKG